MADNEQGGGGLNFQASLDTTKYENAIQRMQAVTKNVTDAIVEDSRRATDALSKIGSKSSVDFGGFTSQIDRLTSSLAQINTSSTGNIQGLKDAVDGVVQALNKAQNAPNVDTVAMRENISQVGKMLSDVDKLKNVDTQAIVSKFEDIASSLNSLKTVGKGSDAGFTNSIEKLTASLEGIKGMSTDDAKAFKTAVSEIGKAFGTITKIKDIDTKGLISNTNNIINALREMKNGVGTSSTSIAKTIRSMGSSISKELDRAENKINASGHKVGTTLKDFAANLKTDIQQSNKDIKAATKSATKAFADMADAMNQSIQDMVMSMSNNSQTLISHLQTVTNNINNATSGLNTANTSLNTAASGTGGAMSMLEKGLATYLTLDAVKEAAKEIFNIRNEYQQLEIAFTTMLGSKVQADNIMKSIMNFAMETPYGLRDTADATKMLIAFGVAAEDTQTILRKLGDLASGVGADLNEVVAIYGKLSNQGRAYTRDINQFTSRGIPMWGELAKVMGVTTQEVKKLVTAGAVGFKEVSQAIDNLTGKGSQFGGLMEAQSKSIGGQLERVTDKFEQMLNSIGKSGEGLIYSSLEGAAFLIDHYEQVGTVLTGLIVIYGAYKTALIVVAAAEKLGAMSSIGARFLETAASLGKVSAASKIAAASLTVQAGAQAALNAVMMANPYVIATTAIVGMIGVMYALTKSMDTAEIAQKKLQGRMDSFKKKLDEIRDQAQQYINVIQDVNATDLQKQVNYEGLAQIMPNLTKQFTLQQLAVAGTAANARRLNEEMDDVTFKNLTDDAEKTKKEVAEIQKRVDMLKDTLAKSKNGEQAILFNLRDAQLQLKVARDHLNTLYAQKAVLDQQNFKTKEPKEQLEILKNQKASIELMRDTWGQNVDKMTLAQQNLLSMHNILSGIGSGPLDIFSRKLNEINIQIGLVNQKIKEGTTDSSERNKANIDADLKRTQEELEALNSADPTTKVIRAQLLEKISGYKKELEFFKDTTEKKAKIAKAAKIDVPLPTGSIAEYDRQIKKLQDTLSKTPVNDENLSKIRQMQDEILALTEKRTQAELIIEVKNFDKILEEKRKRYKEYEDALEYGESPDVANNRFGDLLKGGDSYISFLRNQESALEDLNDKTAQQYAQLIQIRKTLAEIEGMPSAFDRFKNEMESLKKTSSNLTEYLDRLKTEYSTVLGQSATEGNTAKKNYLNEQIKQTEEELTVNYKKYLSTLKGSIDEENAIRAKYADLREKWLGEGRDIAELDKAMAQELSDSYVKSMEGYKRLDRELFRTSQRARLVAEIERAKSNISDSVTVDENGVTTLRVTNEQLEIFKAKLKEAEGALEQFDLDVFTKLANTVAQSADGMSQIEGAVGQVGSAISSLAKGVSELRTVFQRAKKSADEGGYTTVDAYAAAAKFIIDTTTAIIRSAKARKEAEEQYLRSTIALQHEYNMAVNEQIRRRAELNENLFTTDYEGRMRSGFEAAEDAANRYAEALSKIAEAEVVAGQKTSMDWSKVMQTTLSGAAAGAVVGNVIGAVVGGAVGLIGGLFAGKEKVDIFAPLLETYPDLFDAQGRFNKILAQSLLSSDKLDENGKQIVQNILDAADAMEAAQEQIEGVVTDLAGALGDNLRNALVGAFEDGTDASKAFADSVATTLENVISNIMFSRIFGDAFTELEARMKASYDTGGDGSWEDDLYDFFKDNAERSKAFEDALRQAQEAAKAQGVSIFDGDQSERSKGGLTGSAKGITEDTAAAIQGQLNAIRINQAESHLIFVRQVGHLANIERNTAYLISIDAKLSRITGTNGTVLRDTGVNLL